MTALISFEILLINTVFEVDMRIDRLKGLGARIKASRVAAGMSQGHLAASIGSSRQSLSAWERGVASPSAVQLADVAEFLCVCSHTLLFGDSFEKSAIKAMRVRGAAPSNRGASTLNQALWSTDFFGVRLPAGLTVAAAGRGEGAGDEDLDT